MKRSTAYELKNSNVAGRHADNIDQFEPVKISMVPDVLQCTAVKQLAVASKAPKSTYSPCTPVKSCTQVKHHLYKMLTFCNPASLSAIHDSVNPTFARRIIDLWKFRDFTGVSLSFKMMKTSKLFPPIFNCLAILFISLFGLPLQGQDIVVSEEVSLKNDYAYEIVGKLGGNILLFRDIQNQFEVNAFDEELRLRWSRVLDLENRNAQVIAIVPGDTSFHVIYGYRYKGDYYLKHNHYDPKVRIIDSTTISVLKKLYFAPRFMHSISEDKTKLMLFRSDTESDLQVGAYDVYKKEMLWRKRIVFQNGSVRRDFRQMIVTNDGDMFLIMDHESSSRRNKEFNIIRINAADRVIRKRYAVLEDYSSYDIHAEYDNINKRLVLAGLYSEKSKGNALGLYMFTLGLNDKDAKLHLIPFHKELLLEVHGKEVSPKKGLSDFLVKDIIFRRDGGALLIAEMHKEYSRRPNISGHVSDYGRSGWVDYYLEDVLVFSINPDGTDHWNTVLHKKQYSQDDNAMYSSYFVFKTPEKIHLLYNDEIRYENTVSEYVLRGNGYYKRNSVFSTNYQRLKLRFRDGLQIAYNECIVPSERNNRLNLVRITFPE